MELNEDTLELFSNDINYYAQLEKQIIDIKNRIKPFQDKLKLLSIEKKDIEKQLCKTMENNDLTIAELPNSKGSLEYKVKNSVLPIKQSTVKDKITKFFEIGYGSELSFNSLDSEKKGEEIYNYIYAKENREKIKKETLKGKNII